MQVALADVLWDAANTYLSPDGKCPGLTEGYTCPTIGAAMGNSFGPTDEVKNWLCALGCATNSKTLFHKNPYTFTEKTQGIRYMWLLLAMHVAEDEKVMVEVAQ
jgi:hypothetical protein